MTTDDIHKPHEHAVSSGKRPASSIMSKFKGTHRASDSRWVPHKEAMIELQVKCEYCTSLWLAPPILIGWPTSVVSVIS